MPQPTALPHAPRGTEHDINSVYSEMPQDFQGTVVMVNVPELFLCIFLCHLSVFTWTRGTVVLGHTCGQ